MVLPGGKIDNCSKISTDGETSHTDVVVTQTRSLIQDMISWINFHLRAVVSLLTAAENTVARNFARHGDFGDCAVSGDDLVVVDVGCTGGHAFSLSEIRAKAS